MSDEKFGISPYPYWHSQLTDQEVAEMRGLSHRGTGDEIPLVETLSSMYVFNNGEIKIIGCEKNMDNELAGKKKNEPLSSSEIQKLVQFSSNSYLTISMMKTACLLHLARIIEKNLSTELYQSSPNAFFTLVEIMVRITEKIIQRTKAPYQIYFDKYEPLDPGILTLSPVRDYRSWKYLYDAQNRVRAGKALAYQPITLEVKSAVLKDDGDWQKIRDKLQKELEQTNALSEIAAAGIGDTPIINKYIKNLNILNFSDLEAQTHEKYPQWRFLTVYDKVEYIIYHSIVSVILDKNGNLAYLPHQHFPYALCTSSEHLGHKGQFAKVINSGVD